MTRGNKRLVLFDLDGVIVDSRKNMEVSWSAVRATYDIDIEFESYFRHIGRPFLDIMEKLGLEKDGENIHRIYNVVSSSRLDLIEEFPGISEVIRELRKNKLVVGLVTSKDKERTLEIVRKLDLLFDVIDCPEKGQRGKPNPDPLMRAMLQCQKDPADTIYIGDMQVDYEATARAGVDYMHANWGYGECDAKTKKLDSSGEILKALLG
ncbi:hypothetical protein MNBD_NITROSPINAE02-1767 [hydrothermal vent metagenome]|uniref:Phosphoglycolate phosphatase n=1 Tax=hydrothermal vent metagenome TaxID=652676 RepID=A0A3B1CIF4_9ZZZZ